MVPISKERQDWLPELTLALRSIATAMKGQEPTPDRLTALAARFADAVPGHRIEVHWFERGYLNYPEIDDPGEPEYGIAIYGERLNAGWLVAATDLPDVLSRSISN